MEARGRRCLSIMRKLSGTTWGATSKIIKTVYTGSVRPLLEYASTSRCTAANTNKAKLDKIQNAGLRTILGATKTTTISEKEKTANVQPLENRRLEKLLIQGERPKDSNATHSTINTKPPPKSLKTTKSKPPSQISAKPKLRPIALKPRSLRGNHHQRMVTTEFRLQYKYQYSRHRWKVSTKRKRSSRLNS